MSVPQQDFSNHQHTIRDEQRKLTDESGASERMRLEHMKHERDHKEKALAKANLAEKKKIYDRNKIEIQRREVEIRRLQGEMTRAEVTEKQFEDIFTDTEEQVIEQKRQINESGDKIQKLQLELAQLKNEHDKQARGLQHFMAEKGYKEKTLEAKKTAVTDLDKKKKREASEIERIRGENVRLEHEIRLLEQKVK